MQPVPSTVCGEEHVQGGTDTSEELVQYGQTLRRSQQTLGGASAVWDKVTNPGGRVPRKVAFYSCTLFFCTEDAGVDIALDRG